MIGAPLYLAVLTTTAAGAPQTRWTELAPGVQHALIAARADTEDRGLLEVVRIDPSRVRFEILAASALGLPNQTAGRWPDQIRGRTETPPKAVVVINAGMFAQDQSTHVGLMACDKELHGTAWNKRYESALVIGPRSGDRPAATLLDLDVPGMRAEAGRYRTIVQNLRLIRGPGQSVWKRSERRWSEAAIGLDRSGRLLLLFAREAHTMPAFNARILRELDVVRAQHVEGGPEASLSIRSRALEADRQGTFETGFFERTNPQQWALPNVLAIIADG